MSVIQQIQADGFSVTVVRSARRKTVSLKVTNKGAFVLIPHRLPLNIASAFIDQKTPWLKAKLEQQAARKPTIKDFTSGEVFNFLGQPYRLQFSLANAPVTVSINKKESVITLSGRINKLAPTTIKAHISKWYQQQAEHYLIARTAHLSQTMNLTPTSIIIKSYKARWGSCNQAAGIQYNWKIIMAPPAIIDYLIIHELSHIAQPNHSSSFWQLVARFDPKFKVHRQWLKEQGYSLSL